MKKILVSVSLAAGAAGLSSALAQSLDIVSPKLWNVSANLRGFYDDNYTSGHQRSGSGGIEASSTVSANVDLQQTDFGVRYTFGMYYYFQRANDGISPLDYTHQADFWFDHSFDETFKLNATDSFVIAQDPQLVQGGSTRRVGGNNLDNRANLSLTKEWTRQFSTTTHYANNLVVYDNNGNRNGGITNNPSQAALLNRMEQSAGMDFSWQFQQETTGFIGYTFTWVRYTAGQTIAHQAIINGNTVNYFSDARNTDTHYAYIGASHQFSANLSGIAKIGGSETDLYNDPVSPSTSLAPYADISATYTFSPGSYVQGGFSQNQNSTDVVTPNPSLTNGHLTQYQESSVFYMDVTHRFDAKLTGTLITQYSYSKFKEGAYNGQGDSSVNAGVNLAYAINRHFSAEAGYNFDELFSNIAGRGNTRNRVYLGLGANY
ncbi:MAG TPA: outer membrane beta-barrel protein [Verrucomicrobiae bacterium]|jgi:hypothetical protein